MLPSPPAQGGGGDLIPPKGTIEEPDQLKDSSKFFLLLLAMRPKQWIKNLVLFAPLVFSERLLILSDLLRTSLAFLLFCLLAGAVYLINDISDRNRDRVHPEKCRRPIASGNLPVGTAAGAAVFLLLASLLGGVWWFDRAFLLILSLYFVLNLFYSFWLKRIVIIDVMSIAGGFLLRAMAGAVSISVLISPWLILCTILLSLFLGFCKRRQELTALDGRASDHREILSEYSTRFLDQMISIVTTATLMAYTFYTLSPEVEDKLGTSWLYLTVPFVLYGIFRYLYLVYRLEQGGNPTRALLTDLPLLLAVTLWGLTVILILYPL